MDQIESRGLISQRKIRRQDLDPVTLDQRLDELRNSEIFAVDRRINGSGLMNPRNLGWWSCGSNAIFLGLIWIKLTGKFVAGRGLTVAFDQARWFGVSGARGVWRLGLDAKSQEREWESWNESFFQYFCPILPTPDKMEGWDQLEECLGCCHMSIGLLGAGGDKDNGTGIEGLEVVGRVVPQRAFSTARKSKPKERKHDDSHLSLRKRNRTISWEGSIASQRLGLEGRKHDDSHLPLRKRNWMTSWEGSIASQRSGLEDDPDSPGRCIAIMPKLIIWLRKALNVGDVFGSQKGHFSWRKLEERALSLRRKGWSLRGEEPWKKGVWRGFYTVAPTSSHQSTSKSRFVLREVLEKKTALVSKDQVLCLLQEEEKEVRLLIYSSFSLSLTELSESESTAADSSSLPDRCLEGSASLADARTGGEAPNNSHPPKQKSQEFEKIHGVVSQAWGFSLVLHSIRSVRGVVTPGSKIQLR
ncbi:hypothetical protein M5K25_017901 [Dendrobium thyrsiflorum]|uniref:Uncharacterized protein n=1 Tax=Dendrobium thyrsiflorum TaxID=117978 RepID=A0ABD0UNH2_DENTH